MSRLIGYRHCIAVAKAAKTIGKALRKSGKNIDPELIYSAARLHDIAKGQHKHDIAGGQIFRDLGFGQTGDIVAVHTDLAGGNLHLSLEAKVIYLADKLVEGDRPVTLAERYGHAKRPFTLTPEIDTAIERRFQVAQAVKKELEGFWVILWRKY